MDDDAHCASSLHEHMRVKRKPEESKAHDTSLGTSSGTMIYMKRTDSPPWHRDSLTRGECTVPKEPRKEHKFATRFLEFSS